MIGYKVDMFMKKSFAAQCALLNAYKFSALYCLAIVTTNVLYARLGESLLIPTPFGGDDLFSPLALIVGFWFVLRDYAQRELGNTKILYVMLFGMVLSFVIGGPQIGIASACAFGFSELVDWAFFTFSKRSFAQRILISSIFAAPIDTLLFFGVADWLEVIPGVKLMSWETVITETASKIASAVFIYWRLTRKQDDAVKATT